MIVFPGRIPIAIHPFFWLFAALIGWLNSGTLLGMFIWVGIIFFSVLFHEFGHAITAVCFKQKANIQLIALGGVTTFDGPKLKFWQQFIITFNGPLFGFILFLLATLVLQLNWTQWPTLFGILKATQIANLFWTVVNLLPVLPLDGGQLLRIFLEANFGIRGFKAALIIGTVIAVLISFYFFIIQAFLAGAFFFLFAFQSFDSWRKSRHANRSDRDDGNRQLMIQAESALQEGNLDEAKRLLEEVHEKAAGGMLGHAASQYLAFIAMREGRRKDAYDLLLPVKEDLTDDSLALLHQLAAEQKNYSLVAELSAPCYQTAPSQQMALHNARAFAALKQPRPAGGWLQTAWQEGSFDLNALLNEEEFQAIKDHPDFRQFIAPLKNKDD
ncbi:MAG TPA: site-2 protease family protein [Chlamydiales bacterium]|nr:site-2 protease family protein [Chlamydiales bacterium]